MRDYGINNLNIFIRFSDEGEFGTPRYIMDEPFNKIDGPSLTHYFDMIKLKNWRINFRFCLNIYGKICELYQSSIKKFINN